MYEKYNKIKIIFDVILFKLKLKELKKAYELYKLFDYVFYKKNPVKIEHFKIIKKYDLNDVKTLIKLHNRYVINKNDVINMDDIIYFIYKLLSVSHSFDNRIINFKEGLMKAFENGLIKKLK